MIDPTPDKPTLNRVAPNPRIPPVPPLVRTNETGAWVLPGVCVGDPAFVHMQAVRMWEDRCAYFEVEASKRWARKERWRVLATITTAGSVTLALILVVILLAK